jgi:hypothetical protein
MKANKILNSLFLFSLCANLFLLVVPEELSVGHSYILKKRLKKVTLYFGPHEIIHDHIQRIVSENGMVFGDIEPGHSIGGSYFIAKGSCVTYFKDYSELLKAASLEGVFISESKYMNFL